MLRDAANCVVTVLDFPFLRNASETGLGNDSFEYPPTAMCHVGT